MPDPPDPLLPAVLLALLARLGFLVLSATADGVPLGTFQDEHGAALFLVNVRGEAPGTCVWTLLPAPVPRGLAAHLVTRATYDVLHGGEHHADRCAIAFQGTTHRLAALWNDPGHEARAVPL